MDSIENEEIIDPITMEPIDKDRIISFEQNNKVFYFDIDSLYRYIKHGKEINPLTRIPLDESTLKKLYRYSIDHDIEWLETYIPPRFKHPKPIIEKSTIELNNIFYTHLFNYNGDSSCNLIHILNQVKMTSDEAHCIDFTIKKLNLHFTIIEKLRHLVYSRVVDKFRLRTGYGPESYYYRDIYQEPDYTIAQNKLF